MTEGTRQASLWEAKWDPNQTALSDHDEEKDDE